MKQVSLLIKPASSLCNMHCSYCFYEDVSQHRECASMGVMKEATMKVLIEKAIALDVDHIHFCFQGGEPTVAGIDYFYRFIDIVEHLHPKQKISYAMQTNGLSLNEAWIALFAKYHFLVGVSLDGFMENHNKVRKDRLNQGTFKTIMRHIKDLEKAHIEYNILTVLTHDLAKQPQRLFKFFVDHSLNYIQLIPCLPTLEGHERMDRYCLTPQDFSKFYKTFFDMWYQAYLKGHYLSVTLFDNLIPMYAHRLPQQCGMLGKCHMQFVIEGNGNIYPCDFFVLDEYCCGNIHDVSLQDVIQHEAAQKFLQESKKLCKECETCPFFGMCHGNCKRLSVCYYDEYYCGYKDFLLYSQERMQQIARQLIKSST